MKLPGFMSPAAKAAFDLGQALARGRNQRLSTLHILYGLLSDPDCSVSTLLIRSGYSPLKMREALKTVLESEVSGPRDEEKRPTVELELALKRANEEADRKRTKIGSTELMLAFEIEDTLARLFLEKAIEISTFVKQL